MWFGKNIFENTPIFAQNIFCKSHDFEEFIWIIFDSRLQSASSVQVFLMLTPTKKRPNLAEQLWKVMILIFEKLVKNEANKSFSAPKMVLERFWVILEQE